MKRVLICDDDDLWLEINSDALTRQGYEVILSQTAVGIIDLVAEAHPDLLVMDYLMPKLTGAEATKVLKQHAAYRSIPVILYSSTSNVGEVAEECGADAYLMKNTDRALEELVNRLIG